jgi:hypothetical protein
MGQSGGKTGLLHEHLEKFGAISPGRERGKDDLDRDLLAEATGTGDLREIDVRHASRGDVLEQDVATEVPHPPKVYPKAELECGGFSLPYSPGPGRFRRS